MEATEWPGAHTFQHPFQIWPQRVMDKEELPREQSQSQDHQEASHIQQRKGPGQGSLNCCPAGFHHVCCMSPFLPNKSFVLFCCGLLISIPPVHNGRSLVRINKEMDILAWVFKTGFREWKARPVELWSPKHFQGERGRLWHIGGPGSGGERSRSFGISWTWVRCRLTTFSDGSNLAYCRSGQRLFLPL